MLSNLETLQLNVLSLFRAYENLCDLLASEDPGQPLLERLNKDFERMCMDIFQLNANDVSVSVESSPEPHTLQSAYLSAA